MKFTNIFIEMARPVTKDIGMEKLFNILNPIQKNISDLLWKLEYLNNKKGFKKAMIDFAIKGMKKAYSNIGILPKSHMAPQQQFTSSYVLYKTFGDKYKKVIELLNKLPSTAKGTSAAEKKEIKKQIIKENSWIGNINEAMFSKIMNDINSKELIKAIHYFHYHKSQKGQKRFKKLGSIMAGTKKKPLIETTPKTEFKKTVTQFQSASSNDVQNIVKEGMLGLDNYEIKWIGNVFLVLVNKNLINKQEADDIMSEYSNEILQTDKNYDSLNMIAKLLKEREVKGIITSSEKQELIKKIDSI